MTTLYSFFRFPNPPVTQTPSVPPQTINNDPTGMAQRPAPYPLARPYGTAFLPNYDYGPLMSPQALSFMPRRLGA